MFYITAQDERRMAEWLLTKFMSLLIEYSSPETLCSEEVFCSDKTTASWPDLLVVAHIVPVDKLG